MNGNTRWRLFSHLLIDRSAAQTRLDHWAGEGWELVHIYLGLFARLRRTERTDLRYFLDWTDPNEREDPDYVRLCADAGWEPVQSIDYLNLYASRPGADPTPIQTDPELEYQRFRKKVLRRMLLSTLLVIVMLTAYALISHYGTSDIYRILYPGYTAWDLFRRFFWPMACTTLSAPYLLILLPLWCLGGLAYLLLLIRQLRRWRRALQRGEPLPGLGRRTGRVWGAIRFLGLTSSSLTFLLFLADTLLNRFLNIGYAIGVLIGSVISLWMRWDDQQKRRRSALYCVYGGCLLLCMLLHAPVRSVFQGRIAPPPDAALSLDYPSPDVSRRDGFWGSAGEWEFCLPNDWSTRITLSAQTWVCPELAQRAAEPIPQYMEPVEGVEGLWSDPIDAENSFGDFLLRRGALRLTAQYRDPGRADEALETLLSWADILEAR